MHQPQEEGSRRRRLGRTGQAMAAWALGLRAERGQALRLFGSFQRYSILIAAVTYFIGWMFLYYFLNEFRVDIFAVDIPFQYFFVYAFVALRLMFDAYFWLTALAIVAVVVLTLAPRWILPALGLPDRSPAFAFATAVCWLAALALIFGLGQVGAYASGLLRARSIREAPPSFVEFVLKDPALLPDDPDVAALRAFDPTTNRVATLVLETQDKFFVLVQPVAVETEEERIQSSRVLELNRSDVLYTKTRR